MADITKAEKLAAARKKLKQFQQKNKDANSTVKSTSSSLKSNSPVDSNFIPKDQPQILDNASSGEGLVADNSNVLHQSAPVFQVDCPKQELTHLFRNDDNKNEKYESFFDSIPSKFNDIKQLLPNADTKIDSDKNEEVNDQLRYSNGDKKQNEYNDLITSVVKDEKQLLVNRVEELEHLLWSEKKINAEFQTKLAESHNHILTLQYEIKRLNEMQNQRIIDEVSELENKMKVHLQTIEILVSEKSEFQKEIMLLQENNTANNSKCEELASRLKASRCQVQKLEKELSDYSSNKIQQSNTLKNLEDNVREKDILIKDLMEKLTDAQNEIKELNKRVDVETINQSTLKKDVIEMEKQLSMAQIKLTQLGPENGSDIFKEHEKLKADLEIARKDTEKAWEEGRKCETELKQYITNLNTQVLQANAKCESAERDKDNISLRADMLVQHISDLEKQLNHERNLREAMNETEVIQKLKEQLQQKEQILIEKDSEMKQVLEELERVKEKLSEAELWKENVPDMGLLQQAMESDRVAAARAIEQNNALKQKLQELEEYIIKINNGKLELTEELDKYKHMAGEYRLHLEKYKSRQEMRMVDSVTQTSLVQKSDSVSQTTYHDFVADAPPHEPVSVETIVMIENKLKKTMDKIAELSDDKQRLEHLVLQLQSETETIGEYVTLYQNQRSLLKEKAEERERQMALIAKEREELKTKLDQINTLLARFPHNPEVEDTTCKISSLLGEIQCSSIVQEQSGAPPTFHPCLLCSGKLINV
ncbi:golgin subfamily A member 2 [Halyomorpha halys]|uniref:golgin subfamily A member 2 n=1 Tax=Halyomorpha halys TaxID=286706 RepID=UPI0006D4FE7F|nr:golgin subfamily A member 2 [Halyomorpha halys]